MHVWTGSAILYPESNVRWDFVVSTNYCSTMQGCQKVNNTLNSLVERALTGNARPLEFYLRDNSHLPGPRANMELASDVGTILAASVPKYPENVRKLLDTFTNGDRKSIVSNTPDEFVMLCGIIGSGMCAAVYTPWREENFEMLEHYACSGHWRVRESVALAYQYLLSTMPFDTIGRLKKLAETGNHLQQRAAIAAIAEPPLLRQEQLVEVALEMQRTVLERLRLVPAHERKVEEVRVLRKTLGYTISVVTVAMPEQGFALMRECVSWNDADVVWILKENMKKKRLAKFSEDMKTLVALLAQAV